VCRSPARVSPLLPGDNDEASPPKAPSRLGLLGGGAGGWKLANNKVKAVAMVQKPGLMGRLASLAAPKAVSDEMSKVMDSVNAKKVLKIDDTIEELKVRSCLTFRAERKNSRSRETVTILRSPHAP